MARSQGVSLGEHLEHSPHHTNKAIYEYTKSINAAA